MNDPPDNSIEMEEPRPSEESPNLPIIESSENHQKLVFPKLRFALLNLYAFLFVFNPSSPFLVLFLVEEKHVDKRQIYDEIFPIWTYSYFGCLIVLGIFAEYLGYKAAIILGVIGNIATVVILITANDLIYLQLQEVTMGIASGAYIIFGSYLYRVIEQHYHQKITSFVKASYLCGTVASAVLGQILFGKISIFILLFINLGALALAGVIIVTFPDTPKQKEIKNELNLTQRTNCLQNSKSMARDMVKTYQSFPILRLSIWGGLWLAVHHLIFTYWQSLFLEMDQSYSAKFNGYVSAFAYLAAAACSLIPVKLEPFMEKLTKFFLIIFPLLNGVCIIIMAFNPFSIWVSYVLFILYHSCYEFMGPVINVQIVKYMKNARFGLVFSINTTAAMFFQTAMQFIVGPKALKLEIKHQFYFFGGCLCFLSFAELILEISLKIKDFIDTKRHKYKPMK